MKIQNQVLYILYFAFSHWAGVGGIAPPGPSIATSLRRRQLYCQRYLVFGKVDKFFTSHFECFILYSINYSYSIHTMQLMEYKMEH